MNKRPVAKSGPDPLSEGVLHAPLRDPARAWKSLHRIRVVHSGTLRDVGVMLRKNTKRMPSGLLILVLLAAGSIIGPYISRTLKT